MQCECDVYSRHWVASLQAWGSAYIERASFHFLQLSWLIMPEPDVTEHPECIFHTVMNLLMVSQGKTVFRRSAFGLLNYNGIHSCIKGFCEVLFSVCHSGWCVFVFLVFISVFLPNNWWKWGKFEYSCVVLVSWVVRTNAYTLTSCDFCVHLKLCLWAFVMGIRFVPRMLSKNQLSIPS